MLTNVKERFPEDLVFGCGPIGSFAADGDAATGRAALDAALAAGIRRFDVAPSYGDGRAEELLGEALADWRRGGGEAAPPDAAPEREDRAAPPPGGSLADCATGTRDGSPAEARGGRPRDPVTVATKVGRLAMANANPYARPLAREAPGGGGSYDFSAAGVRRALAAGLERLRLDRVDIAFVHDPDVAPGQARDEAVPALAAARDEGLVGSVGVATTNPAVALPFVESGAVEHVMIAAAWTLTQRGAAELLDRCAERGVVVHAAGPFDSGLLATPRPAPTAPSGYRVATPEHLETASALADVCERHGATLPQAAIQFPLRHPAVEAVVVGMRSPAEVTADLALLTTPVPEPLWKELDLLLPPC
jgi:D-threo-aldose 1-dehydrogenase